MSPCLTFPGVTALRQCGFRITNRFTALGTNIDCESIPDYPIAYDAGKALHTAVKTRRESAYGAQ